MTTVNGLGWDDSALVESGDTQWRRGCRLLQTWWRQEVLGLASYGPLHPPKDGGEGRLVGSMLPTDAPEGANFLDPVVSNEVEFRLAQKGWGGLVSEDRLMRNLLSSQPVAFNLFGFLKHHPRAVIAWLATLDIDATEVEVRIEWAPPKAEHFGGGSAFDVAIFYVTPSGTKGLVGIEVKYSENLEDQRIDPRPEYLDATRSNGCWRSGASDRLREPRLVQLWLNTLLAQSCAQKGTEGVSGATVVMMACAADAAALRATAAVRGELTDPTGLVWSPFEAVLNAVADQPDLGDWPQRFRERYLDFGPVAALLPAGDPRLDPDPITSAGQAAHDEMAEALLNARMVAERVLGEGSVLEQVAAATPPPAPLDLLTLAGRLRDLSEDLRELRLDAFPAWSHLDEG